MPVIRSSTFIAAPIEHCFDLARSIDVHMASTAKTNERAVGGRTSGLIELNETVTWEAVHFGVKQRLTAAITELDRPNRFVDEQVKGAFKRFWHEHRFIEQEGGTLMIDTFDYTSPFGWIGQAADWLFLTRYMDRFLRTRNDYIKRAAEQVECDGICD